MTIRVSAATLAAIHAASFTTPRPWSIAEFTTLLADPATRTAWMPAPPPASATLPRAFGLGRLAADEAEILTLAVDPAARRAGLGRRVLSDLMAQLGAGGAARVFLEVAIDNLPARALYAEAGFHEAGRRPRYFAVPGGIALDALILARHLPDR